MGQSVPKRSHIKFKRRAITQKKAYNVQKKAKVWNQEYLDNLNIFHTQRQDTLMTCHNTDH